MNYKVIEIGKEEERRKETGRTEIRVGMIQG